MSYLDHAKDVESAIEQLGGDPKEAKAALPGSWIVQKGSAKITITLNSSPGLDGGDDTISINSFIMKIPRTKKRIFYRRLLEINRSFISERFEIFDEDIYLSTVRYLEGLVTTEIVAMINDISESSDYWDNKLMAEFGDENK